MVALGTILTSCDILNGDDPSSGDGTGDLPEGYGEFELAEGAVFMDEEMTSLFSSVDDGIIVLPLSVPHTSVPVPGTVLVCPITDRTPAGLLVRITEVEQTVSGYVLKTQTAALADAFEELHVDTSMDISPYIETALDGNGNTIIPEQISPSIWDEFAKDPEDPSFTIPTKASGSAETSLSQKFPLESDIFEGQLFADMKLKVSIDISRQRLNKFDITITKQTGIAGDLLIAGLEAGFEMKIAELEFKFKPFLIPGTPIVIRPSLYAEETFKAEGKIEVKAALRYQFENHLYAFSYNGGQPTYRSESLNEDNYMKFKSLSAEAEMEISSTAGGKFEVYDDALLAFGIELTAADNFRMSNEISMDDDKMLVNNPEVEVTPSLTASIYCESLLFGFLPDTDEGKLSYEWDFGLPSFKLTALPQFSGIQENEAGGKLKVAADVDETCFLECSEKGFALFEEDSDEPITHISFSIKGTETKATTAEEVEFDLPSSDRSYTALPYVVADGRYYYGEEDRWVDLGLPSGILWAKYNVGASSPEEYGGYYSWGMLGTWEQVPEDKYEDEVYGEYKGADISGTEYDAAHVLWGNGARMPINREFEELLNNCTFTVGNYNNVKGNYITGPNGNNIFLPFAGYYEGEHENDYRGQGLSCDYWSSTLEDDDHYQAYSLHIGSSVAYEWDGNWCYLHTTLRELAFCIRPVKDAER